MSRSSVFESLFFPVRCPICEQFVCSVTPGALICDECRRELEYVEEPFCLRCGKPTQKSGSRAYCADCAKRARIRRQNAVLLGEEESTPAEIGYDRGVAVFTYRSVAKPLVHLKYYNRRDNATFFARESVNRYGELICGEWRPDVIVPVPVHSSKKRERGYNQAELLAKEIGQIVRIPVNNLNVRSKKTLPLKEMNPAQRLSALENVFTTAKSTDGIGTVLLVDDIYTTGSTLEANARALKRAGVKRVYFLVMAVGVGNDRKSDAPT